MPLVTGVQTCALPIYQRQDAGRQKGDRSGGERAQNADAGKLRHSSAVQVRSLQGDHSLGQFAFHASSPSAKSSRMGQSGRSSPRHRSTRSASAIRMDLRSAIFRSSAFRFSPVSALPLALDRRLSRQRSSRSRTSRSEEHTSELQSLMRISYAAFCLEKNKDESQL